MPRRNLSSRPDIPADALRQRRDLYVIAIGLLIYNLAGGIVREQTTVSGLMPVQLHRPEILLWVAWVGLGYFWWRFWLVSEARPIKDFLADVGWQLGDTGIVRAIAAPHVERNAFESAETLSKSVLAKAGPVPKVAPFNATLSLNSLESTKGRGVPQNYGPANVTIPKDARWRYAWAHALAFARAVSCERTFTDYTLPHLFASLTVVVGLVRFTARSFS